MKQPYTVKRTLKGSTIVDLGVSINEEKDFPVFRYRAIDKYSIYSFLENSIYGTPPERFNDPYDCTGIFDQNYFKKELRKIFTSMNIVWNKENSLAFLKIQDRFLEEFRNISSQVRVSSFSSHVNDEIMWAHYAGKATGFVLEYSYNDLIQIEGKKSKVDLFYPVQYLKSRFNYTKEMLLYLKKMLGKHSANEVSEISWNMFENDAEKVKVLVFNWFFKKNVNWSYENEWRLLSLGPDYSEKDCGDKICELQPKAIYYGEKMSPIDLHNLMNIASEKGLKQYQMISIPNISSSSIKLVAMELPKIK